MSKLLALLLLFPVSMLAATCPKPPACNPITAACLNAALNSGGCQLQQTLSTEPQYSSPTAAKQTSSTPKTIPLTPAQTSTNDDQKAPLPPTLQQAPKHQNIFQ